MRELKIQTDFPTPLLHMTYILQQSADELLLASLGVGLSSVRVMSALSEKGPRSQQIIAALLNQTESNVSRQLKTMKKQGLVNIAKNKKDGRQKDVTLTQTGKSKFKKAEKILEAQQKRLLTKNDSKDLELIIGKMLNNI